MKKTKQVLAIIGIILLAALYAGTLICAIIDHSGTMQLLFASIVATAIIPVLIWAYSFIYQLLKKYYGSSPREDSEVPSEESSPEETESDEARH